MKLVLASASPRRKQLLEKLELTFDIKISNVDEALDPKLSPYHNTVMLAAKKARAVAAASGSNEHSVIIGGDTLVVIDGQCLGQPESREAAIEMLKCLAGRWHEVCTGVALIEVIADAKVSQSSCADAVRFPQQPQEIVNWSEQSLKYTLAYEISKVKMRQLSVNEIESYVDTGECFGVAGSYALQGIGAVLIERMEGCVSNVIGLPLPLVTKMLRFLGL